MTIDPTIARRLQFLVRVLRKECQHLVSTDQRLFGSPFTQGKARQLEADADYASRHVAKWQLALAWLGTAALALLASNRESWIVFGIATVMWSWVSPGDWVFNPASCLPLSFLPEWW